MCTTCHDHLNSERYYTQADILHILRSEGYDVGISTLRYWRSIGLVPKLYETDSMKGYPLSVIDTIRELCDNSGRLLGDEISVRHLEGDVFKVYAYFITMKNGKYQVQSYTDQGVITEQREDLDGLLR